jgi:UDP-N-acetylmuramyl tripeptide synthase
MRDSTRSSPLAGVLAELGWQPEVLARRLNGFAALHGRAERVHT